MGAVITKASSFGTVGTTFYTLLKYIKKNYGENLEICDVGCLDGIYTIPFLKKGYKVYAFEMNMIYLYGGHVQLPIINENTENLNSNQYIKQCEMQKYFKDGWDILSIVEDRNGIDELPHIGNPTFHKHRVGMIKARKNKQFKPEYFKVNLIF